MYRVSSKEAFPKLKGLTIGLPTRGMAVHFQKADPRTLPCLKLMLEFDKGAFHTHKVS